MEEHAPFRVIAKFLCRGSPEAEVSGLSWFLDDSGEFDRELQCPYPLFHVDDEVSVSLLEREGAKRFIVAIGGKQVFAEMPFVVEGIGSLLLKWAGRPRGRGTLSCIFNGRGDLDVSTYGEFVGLPSLGLGDTFSVKVADYEVFESSEGNPRGVLVEFSQGRADHHRVMRALIEFEGWVVPITILNSHYRQFDFPAVYDFGVPTRLPPDRLWLFTDTEAVRHALAQGYGPGLCGAGVPGTELFSNLNPDWAEVFINPGSPVEESYYQQPHAEYRYHYCTKFAEAVRLEKAIDRLGTTRPEELLSLVRSHQELFVVVLANDSFLTAYLPDHRTALLVFTAPDCVHAGLGLVCDPGLVANPKTISLSGELVLKATRDLGYSCLALNLGSPRGSCVLATSAGESKR
jgi:hypothetical protein